MRYFLIVLSLLVGVCYGALSATTTVYDYNFGPRKTLSGDVLVENTGALMVDSIYITSYVYIENFGIVDVDNIYVCDNCDFFLENSGRFKGDFIVGNNVDVFQVLRNPDDIRAVDFNVPYSVLIQDSESLVLSEVLDVANEADKIILNNATLVLNTDMLNNMPIVINGENLFVVDGIDDLYTNAIFTNVSGDGRVYFRVLGDDNPLFANVGYFENDNLYVRRERVTDYASILTNDVGIYLNNLRVKNPQDPLLGVLDGVGDMNALRETIARSVRLNPIRLMQPVLIVAGFDKLDFNIGDVGINLGVNTVINDNLGYYGIDVGFGGGAKNTQFVLSLNIGSMEYRDDINYFMGDVYGGRLVLEYKWSDANRVRAMIGGKFIDFTSGELFNGRNTMNDPRGVMMYGVAEYVHDFGMLSSFVGFDFDYISVMDDYENNIVGRAGGESRYTQEMLGLRYEYAMRIGANTDSAIFAELNVGFLSVMDNSGADASVAIIRQDDMTSYKFRLSARVLF